MKIYLIETDNNIGLYKYLKNKYDLTKNIYIADVVIIHKVYDINSALEIVDFALTMGKEIICIKSEYAKEHYLSNYLIKNGAIYV